MGGERVELGDVELAELLDVDGTTVLVGLVIVLRVVLRDLFVFGIVKAVTVSKHHKVSGGGGFTSLDKGIQAARRIHPGRMSPSKDAHP